MTYNKIIVGILMIAISLNLPVYVSNISYGDIPPKNWYYLFAAALIPIFAGNVRRISDFFKTKFIKSILLLMGLYLIHLTILILFNETAASDVARSEILILGISVMICFALHISDIDYISRICFFASLVLTGLQIYDFIMPNVIITDMDSGYVPGRASSVYINANQAGYAFFCLAIVSLPAIPHNWRILYILVITPGIFLTFSRSSILAWVIIFFGLFTTGAFKVNKYAIMGIIISIFAIFSIFAVNLSGIYGESIINDRNREGRMRSILEGDFSDNSSVSRMIAAQVGLDAFFESPIIGKGLGYTRTWGDLDFSVHNQHILMLAELGIIGEFIFIYILYTIFTGNELLIKLRALRFKNFILICLLIVSFSSHNMLNQLYSITFLEILSRQKK